MESLEEVHDLTLNTSEDIIKDMMSGARVTMLAFELLKNGCGRIAELAEGVEQWMQEHQYIAIKQVQGSMSQAAVREPAAFEHANYMKVLGAYKDLP